MLAASLASCGSKETSGEETTAVADSTHEENENSVEITQAQYQSIGIELGSAELKGLSALIKVSGYIDVPRRTWLA